MSSKHERSLPTVGPECAGPTCRRCSVSSKSKIQGIRGKVVGKVKSLTISFDCLNDSNVPVYSSGDTVSGRVNLEVTGEIRVKSLKIHARGHAKVRWTESRNAGSNTAYTQNYTEEVEYFNHKDILIGHERGKFLY